MRGYHEAVDVSVGAGEEPVAFEWRGRRYRVMQVLDSWRERVPWWRVARGPGRCDPSEAAGARVETEQRAWRVEATAGRPTSSGVFHLVHRGDQWSLHALTD